MHDDPSGSQTDAADPSECAPSSSTDIFSGVRRPLPPCPKCGTVMPGHTPAQCKWAKAKEPEAEAEAETLDDEEWERVAAIPSQVADAITDILGVQEDGTWNVSPFRWRGRIESQLRRLTPNAVVEDAKPDDGARAMSTRPPSQTAFKLASTARRLLRRTDWACACSPRALRA
jgi:hypothetical protein